MPEVTLSCRNCRRKTRRSSNCKKCPRCGALTLFRPKEGGDKIIGLVADSSGVTLTLKNGVRVSINSNDGYLHIDFGGIATRYSKEANVLVRQDSANSIKLDYLAINEEYG